PFLSANPFPPDSVGVARTAFAGMSFQVVKFDASPTQVHGVAELQSATTAQSRRKKRRPTPSIESLGPGLLPADDRFWDLPEEDSSLARDLEVL
ncbi:hypothetical protein FRC01_001184, partial [Tulasnella sp. 417]